MLCGVWCYMCDYSAGLLVSILYGFFPLVAFVDFNGFFPRCMQVAAGKRVSALHFIHHLLVLPCAWGALRFGVSVGMCIIRA